MKNGAQWIKGVIILAAVFCIPRVISNRGADFTTLKNWAISAVSNKTEAPPAGSQGNAAPPAKPIVVNQDTIQNKGDVDVPLPPEMLRSKPTPLNEVLWFDYVPNDIVQRWPYVTAASPELHVQAYRAPFFTGTTAEDLEGVVTYYFDTHDKIQQISIKAKTGDFRKLVEWLQKYYGFVQRETQSPVVYLYEQPYKSPRNDGSRLWIRPSQAFAEGYDYKRFDITLVVNRPKP